MIYFQALLVLAKEVPLHRMTKFFVLAAFGECDSCSKDICISKNS